MEVTVEAVERIPRGNVRVPLDDFVALWKLAEHFSETSRGAGWYAAGVVMTCRWMASVAVPSVKGRWELAWAPVTERSGSAHEETIAAELLATELELIRTPAGREGRPGWLEGVLATLRWAWARSAIPPFELPASNAS